TLWRYRRHPAQHDKWRYLLLPSAGYSGWSQSEGALEGTLLMDSGRSTITIALASPVAKYSERSVRCVSRQWTDYPFAISHPDQGSKPATRCEDDEPATRWDD